MLPARRRLHEGSLRRLDPAADHESPGDDYSVAAAEECDAGTMRSTSCDEHEAEQVEYEIPQAARASTSTSSASSLLSENSAGDAWREFDHSTEAGRLLHRLYAKVHNRPLAKYPKVRTQKSDKPKPSWCNVQPLATNPHEASWRQERVQALSVPKAPSMRSRERPAPILFAPKRKSLSSIQKEHLGDAEERRRVRPLPRKAVSTEFEKRRLAIHFQFKGGKALPKEGIAEPIAGNIPLSLITGKPTRHGKLPREKAQRRAQAVEEERRTLEAEFDECAGDIDALRAKLEKAEASHGGVRGAASLKSELQQRLSDMQRIDELLLGLPETSVSR